MKEENIKDLKNCKSLDEFFARFFGLSFQERMSVLGNEYTVPAGTILYRARKYNGIPLVNENEWWLAPPKYVKRGRFNYDRKPILYLGTMEFVLPREIGLKPGDSYYLAKYECVTGFKVGSLLKTNSLVTYVLHKVAMAIENDSKLTENERKNLRVRFDEITPMRILDDYNSPFYLHRCMKKDLYMVTNRLADLIMQKSPCGIRYCSCFIPTEMSGGPQIITLDGEIEGNYALTEKGISNLRWLGCERKMYTEEDYKSDMSMWINIVNNSMDKEDT